MTWKTLLNKIKKPKKLYALNVVISDKGNRYTAIELELNNDQLNILNKYDAKNLDEIIPNLSKNHPLIIAFSGQRIITKKVLPQQNYESQILFNSNPNDFYWYELVEGNHLFVSVIRKEVVDSVLTEIKGYGLFVVDMGIGPLTAYPIKPFLLVGDTLGVEDVELIFNEDVLLEVKKRGEHDNEISYQIGDENIHERFVIPFGVALNHLYPGKISLKEKEFLIKNQEEFKFKMAFNKGAILTLAIFFVALFTSYFLLGHYQNKYLELQVAIGEQNVGYEKVIALENDIENKKAILNESGLGDSKFLTYYTMQITAKVPKEINLKELRVFPLKNKIKPNEKVAFHHKSIEIEGTTISNLALTGWIKELKRLNWVNTIEIQDFSKESRSNSFKINLFVKFNV